MECTAGQHDVAKQHLHHAIKLSTFLQTEASICTNAAEVTQRRAREGCTVFPLTQHDSHEGILRAHADMSLPVSDLLHRCQALRLVNKWMQAHG